MYGEYVEIEIANGVNVKVYVACTPQTSELEKKRKAIYLLDENLPEYKRALFEEMETRSLEIVKKYLEEE